VTTSLACTAYVTRCSNKTAAAAQLLPPLHARGSTIPAGSAAAATLLQVVYVTGLMVTFWRVSCSVRVLLGAPGACSTTSTCRSQCTPQHTCLQAYTHTARQMKFFDCTQVDTTLLAALDTPLRTLWNITQLPASMQANTSDNKQQADQAY
jgi:hypothetical protein